MKVRIAEATLILVFFLCGCGARPGSVVQEVVEQTWEVNADAKLRLADACGSVSIRGTDSSEVKLRATKRSSSPAQLKNIGVTLTGANDDVSIKTTLIRQKAKPFFFGGDSVDYSLVVPRTFRITRLDMDNGKILIEGMQGCEIRANVVDGQMELRNCAGKIGLVVGHGTLDLLYDREEMQPSEIEALVMSGDLKLRIPRSGSFHLRAEAPNGRITNYLSATVELNQGVSRKIELSSGRPPRSEIQLRVMTGNIVVAEENRGKSGTTFAAGQ